MTIFKERVREIWKVLLTNLNNVILVSIEYCMYILVQQTTATL